MKDRVAILSETLQRSVFHIARAEIAEEMRRRLELAPKEAAFGVARSRIRSSDKPFVRAVAPNPPASS